MYLWDDGCAPAAGVMSFTIQKLMRAVLCRVGLAALTLLPRGTCLAAALKKVWMECRMQSTNFRSCDRTEWFRTKGSNAMLKGTVAPDTAVCKSLVVFRL